MAPVFPMFLNLDGKTALVIGAGNVAARKIEKLLLFGPKIQVVASQMIADSSTKFNT
jgi:siroheme synthase (precorrin-2 oxidase/ferrochelatase)